MPGAGWAVARRWLEAVAVERLPVRLEQADVVLERRPVRVVPAERCRRLRAPRREAGRDPAPVGAAGQRVRRTGRRGLALAELRLRAGQGPARGDQVGPNPTDRAKNGTKRGVLTEADGGTSITLTHTALGLFPEGYREALSEGWPALFERIRRRVEKA